MTKEEKIRQEILEAYVSHPVPIEFVRVDGNIYDQLGYHNDRFYNAKCIFGDFVVGRRSMLFRRDTMYIHDVNNKTTKVKLSD
jgi:hypothetical protein